MVRSDCFRVVLTLTYPDLMDLSEVRRDIERRLPNAEIEEIETDEGAAEILTQ